MNEFMENFIDKTIGIEKECDVCANETGWGKVFRVLVELDLHQPILRGRTINLSRVASWIPLTCENLPRLCFRCDRIPHHSKFCDKGSHKLNAGTD